MFNSESQLFLIFIAGCAVFILLLVCVIIFFVKQYQQRQSGYFAEIEDLKDAHRVDILRTQLEIREQTLENVATEIHDNIGQKLTLVTLHLNLVDHENKAKAKTQVDDTLNIVKKVIFDLRHMSRTMNSGIALKEGLLQAIKTEADQLENSGVYEVALVVSGNAVALPKDTEVILFRIVQESLNNIIKHAEATRIEILIDYAEDKVSLTINDNGKGFEETSETGNGCGLENMKKRAAMLNGSFFIESEKQSGTNIIIKIPIHHDKEI